MDDQPHRKLPSDRPFDVLASGSNKKTKNDSSQATMDTDDSLQLSISKDSVAMEQDTPVVKIQNQSNAQPISYKDSLLGFNGIANGSSNIEEELLLSDVINKKWEMPKLTEKIRLLMQHHPVVPISADEYSDWCKPWNTSLIITVLGKRYNVYTLKAHLCRLWHTQDFDLVDLPNNYFIVRFLHKEGWTHLYQKVLYEGPWVVQQHTILVQKWIPNFDPFNNPLRRIVTWVRVPNIPMQCYNAEVITRLGNRIARTMKIDLLTLSAQSSTTAKIERGRYARICVELDLQKKLVSRVIAANSAYQVEYEGLGLICFAYKRYGHRKELCQWTYVESSTKNLEQARTTPLVVTAPSPAMKAPKANATFRSWMLVGNSSRSRSTKKHHLVGSSSEPGIGTWLAKLGWDESKFSALADLNEEEEVMIACYSSTPSEPVQGMGDLQPCQIGREDKGKSHSKPGDLRKMGKTVASQELEICTHPLIWLLAIICTIIAVVVVISGIVVFIGYLVIHPKVPVISVTNAHLDLLRNDYASLMETHITIVVRAQNGNSKAHATFSDIRFNLTFQGQGIAMLVADPFEVPKNNSRDLNYVVQSSSIPLTPDQMEQINQAWKYNEIAFDLKGDARTQRRVGPLGYLKFSCHLNCRLRFHPLNGTYIPSRCTSKSK